MTYSLSFAIVRSFPPLSVAGCFPFACRKRGDPCHFFVTHQERYDRHSFLSHAAFFVRGISCSRRSNSTAALQRSTTTAACGWSSSPVVFWTGAGNDTHVDVHSGFYSQCNRRRQGFRGCHSMMTLRIKGIKDFKMRD